MVPTTSYIFSNDTRATDFRREVRNRVARRQEYAVAGLGASAQEVQRAYLRYCREQQNQRQQGQSSEIQQAPPPYGLSMDNQALLSYNASTNDQAPPSYHASTNDHTPPPYSSTATTEITPTARLELLLQGNASTPPSPPEYTEAITTPPPPRYQDIASVGPTSSSTNQTPSYQTMRDLFANCTTRTPRKQIHKQAIQALELVIVPEANENRVSLLPPRPSPKRRGILRRMKERA